MERPVLAQQSKTHADQWPVCWICNPMEAIRRSAFGNPDANVTALLRGEVGKGVIEYYYNITDSSELINGSASAVSASSHSD